jgi:hypothetical protein
LAKSCEKVRILPSGILNKRSILWWVRYPKSLWVWKYANSPVAKWNREIQNKECGRITHDIQWFTKRWNWSHFQGYFLKNQQTSLKWTKELDVLSKQRTSSKIT